VRRIFDAILEMRIRLEMARMVKASDKDAMRRHAKEMARLIALRSPQKVARMERERGLTV